MAIAPVNGSTVNNGATPGVSLSFGAISIAAGGDIVVAVAILTTTVSVTGITDTALNTYTLKSSVNNGANVRVEIWEAHNVTGNAADVIVVALSGATLAAAAFEQYSGVSAVGNIGATATGSGFTAEGDVATQDGNNWSVCAIAAATSSGDTLTADMGAKRQASVPAATAAAIALVDNSSIGIVSALRGDVMISASRQWAAAAIELRSGGGAINFTSASIPTPTGSAASFAKHQVTKATAGPISSGGGPSTPVPVAQVLKGGVIGSAYTETISTQGGVAPYAYAVVSGALPTGATLNTSSGVISGATLTAAGTFSFTIQVTDANGAIGTTAFQIIVSAPVASNYGFVS
jgi:hypothetical protein